MNYRGRNNPGPQRSGLEKPEMDSRGHDKSLSAQFARRLQKIYAIPQERDLDGMSMLLSQLSEKLDPKAE